MAALTSNEAIGTPARLGVLRLGAGRLGAIPRASQITSGGIYAWARVDSGVKHGDPPGSVTDAWMVKEPGMPNDQLPDLSLLLLESGDGSLLLEDGSYLMMEN